MNPGHAIPLTRRLGALEIVDAAVWFARDRAAAVLATAGGSGLGFALAVTAFYNRMTAFRPGTRVAEHAPELLVWSALLSAIFIARGLGHWAAIELLAGTLQGEKRTPESCWAAAVKNALPALFFGGVIPMAQGAGLLVVAPGLIVLNRWGIAPAAAVFERLAPGRALSRSRDLMGKSIDGMAIWGFLLLAWGVLFVNALMAGALLPDFLRTFFGVNLPRLEAAISPGNGLFVVAALAATWAACDTLRCIMFAILYLNARIEREGGDLLARLQALRAGRRGAAAAPEVAHA